MNEVKTEIEGQIKTDSMAEVKVEEDSDLSDREPSSTVTIKTPDINNIDDSSTLGTLDVDKSSGASTTVWKGFVNMPDVAKFFTTVQVVSGDSQNLCKDLPDTVDIVGRYVSFYLTVHYCLGCTVMVQCLP
jgi:SPOC domain.